MKKSTKPAPFVKWPGGKRQLLPEIKKLLTPDIYEHVYVEPFIGGGALLFDLCPKRAVICDINSDLTDAYLSVKNHVDELIGWLKKYENTSDCFYDIRQRFNCADYSHIAERASMFIYLNKTCFNGLYRVNNKGEFNASFGRYKNPNIVNEDVLRADSKYLNENDVRIMEGDYGGMDIGCLCETEENSEVFFYLDPPYHNTFTKYVEGGWDEEDYIELRDWCVNLTTKAKCPFVMSNSATDLIKDLFKWCEITTVKAKRSINCDTSKRGAVDEFLIRNYHEKRTMHNEA